MPERLYWVYAHCAPSRDQTSEPGGHEQESQTDGGEMFEAAALENVTQQSGLRSDRSLRGWREMAQIGG